MERLRASASALGMKSGELWLAYFALGGNGTSHAVEAWLDGRVAPERGDYNVLAVAVNEELVARGLDADIPYADVTSNN